MKPLKLIATALLLVCTAGSYGQRNKKTPEAFYSFDEHWQEAGLSNAMKDDKQVESYKCQPIIFKLP